MPASPRVSIGLPVYNGEVFLRFMLDSIISQTFPDFELIISDNASTDDSLRICQEYADRDDRIRVYRQPRNTGVAENLNFVFRMATAPYFCWAAHDDVLHPEFLSKLVSVLDSDAVSVLAFPRIRQINENSRVEGEWRWSQEEIRTDSSVPRERFQDLISVHHGCGPLFGVIRSEALRKTRLNQKYPSSDRNLLVELGLIGPWHFLPEPLLDRRRHPRDSLRLYPNPRDRVYFYNPEFSGLITFPTWRTVAEYVVSVLRSDLDTVDKVGCLRDCAVWCRRKWKPLLIEVKTAPGLIWRNLKSRSESTPETSVIA